MFSKSKDVAVLQAPDSTSEAQPPIAVAVPGAIQHHYVHPEAAALFARLPWTQRVPLFSESTKGVGPRCTVALGVVYFLNKGLSKNLVALSRYAMLRSRFGVDGTRYQRLAALYNMGQSLKAFSASVSDTFALFGYTKRWYCAGSCVAGAAFALAYGLLPAQPSSANTGAGMMFIVIFCMANVDIFSQGHYSRILRQRPDSGPALVSWIWFFVLVSAIVSAAIQGPMSDKGIPQVCLYVSAAAQLVTAVFFIFNWYGERPNTVERREDVLAVRAHRLARRETNNHTPPAGTVPTPGGHLPTSRATEYQPSAVVDASQHSDALVAELPDAVDDVEVEKPIPYDEDRMPISTPLCFGAVEFNREVCVRNWRLFVYSAIMVAAVVAQCLVTVFGTSHDLGWCSLAVVLICCSVAFWACKLVVAKAIVFIFLDMVIYVQIPGAVDSFFMAPASCYPEGPHFTYVFYNTVAAIIGNVGGLVGVTAFSYLFSKHSYCLTFVVTTVIKVLASVFDIIIVKRWNLYVGIPDHAMYVLGDAIVYEVCYQFSWLPVVLLFSRICPRGSESMIYALAAGFGNVGQSLSNTIGSLFIELVWPIKTTGVNGCDFSNVPMLLLVSHMLLPLVVIPASFLLLPRARVCDDLDDEGNAMEKEDDVPKMGNTGDVTHVPSGTSSSVEEGERRV